MQLNPNYQYSFPRKSLKTMSMFVAPFNPLYVTFGCEFHASHSLPQMCSYYNYCLIIFQLVMLQYINKSSIVYQ